MLKIKFADGTEYEYITAIETEEFYNGSSRRTLTIESDADAISIDTLSNVLNDEKNAESIVMTNDNPEAKNAYSGYVLKLSCGTQKKLIKAETPETPAVYEDRLIVKLGKRTYIEEALKRLGM